MVRKETAQIFRAGLLAWVNRPIHIFWEGLVLRFIEKFFFAGFLASASGDNHNSEYQKNKNRLTEFHFYN